MRLAFHLPGIAEDGISYNSGKHGLLLTPFGTLGFLAIDPGRRSRKLLVLFTGRPGFGPHPSLSQ
jgi:hypothetical protein